MNYNFLNKINSKKESIKIINNLYQGDVYLIRNTISKKFILDLKKYLIDKAKIDPSSFYKIKEGCPNFNRIIKKKHKKEVVIDNSKEIENFLEEFDKIDVDDISARQSLDILYKLKSKRQSNGKSKFKK